MGRSIILSLLAATLVACSAQSSAPDHITTTSISQSHLSEIDRHLTEEVLNGVRSGFVVMVAHKGDIAYEQAFGMADIEAGKEMQLDTQFRIASMTKPITSLAIMMLVERGDILLTDPVSLYIPAFENMQVATAYNVDASGTIPTRPATGQITIHHLLTHTSGLGYIFDWETDLGREMVTKSIYNLEGDLAARIDAIAEFPLYTDPGTEWRYSYATDVLGRVIEVASGKPLDQFFQEEIFAPLKMTSTSFFMNGEDLSNLAKVYIYTEDGRMVEPGKRENLPDPNVDRPTWPSGGGGLVSTAGDYMRFAQMLLNEGELDGARIVSPATVRLMLSPHVTEDVLRPLFRDKGRTVGLGGWVVTEPGLAGETLAKGQWGWGGYYDTTFSISPADDLAIIVLAQREPGPHAPESRAQELVKSIVFGALE
jgi:CubicO group peptidase (beta-lactamase class C family)